MHPNYEAIYKVVRTIPKGRVATYGQVARLAGLPRHARQVGYALHHLPENSTLPWHRVVNARGEISKREERGAEREQLIRLQMEGVLFKDGRIDLKRYGLEDGVGRASVR